MNLINTTQTYVRPSSRTTALQQFRNLELFEFPGGRVLWRMAGKAALLMLPLVLFINLLVGSAVSSLERQIIEVDNRRHLLMDKNIEMLARKARLWAPEHVRELAAEKLSLYDGSRGQVGTFSRRKGSFIYL